MVFDNDLEINAIRTIGLGIFILALSVIIDYKTLINKNPWIWLIAGGILFLLANKISKKI